MKLHDPGTFEARRRWLDSLPVGAILEDFDSALVKRADGMWDPMEVCTVAASAEYWADDSNDDALDWSDFWIGKGSVPFPAWPRIEAQEAPASPIKPDGWAGVTPDGVRAVIDASPWHSASIARAMGVDNGTVWRWRTRGVSKWATWYTLRALVEARATDEA